MAELICIGCPMGCRIQVEKVDEIFKISGHGCKRGEDYARDETISPKRVLTGVVKVTGLNKVLSVKTEKAIPKVKINQAFLEIKDLTVEAPVKIGQVVKENLAGTGVAVLATKNIEKVF